jgi:hypothetical protein
MRLMVSQEGQESKIRVWKLFLSVTKFVFAILVYAEHPTNPHTRQSAGGSDIMNSMLTNDDMRFKDIQFFRALYICVAFTPFALLGTYQCSPTASANVSLQVLLDTVRFFPRVCLIPPDTFLHVRLSDCRRSSTTIGAPP